MQGSTCNFLEGLCVITEGFWIQEKERCSVITYNHILDMQCDILRDSCSGPASFSGGNSSLNGS